MNKPQFVIAALLMTVILGMLACGPGEPEVTRIVMEVTATPAPPPAVTPSPSSDSNRISKANQEYLKQIGVVAVLTPVEKATAIGVSQDMGRLTDCYMERTAQALDRPRGEMLASIPYISEFYSSEAGSTLTADRRLTYQRKRLNAETLTPIVGPCVTDAYAHYGEIKEAQEREMLEVGKAGGMALHIGLLSPDLDYNCPEWTRMNHANYLSLRAGSVKRRGEAAGLRFDYAWAKAKGKINLACAS